MPFNVLFVCTGNICRSPLAERLFRDRVGRSDVIEASSAGTAAFIGRAIEDILFIRSTWNCPVELRARSCCA